MLLGVESRDQSLATFSLPSHAFFSPFSPPLHPFLCHLSFICQHQYNQRSPLSLLLHPCPYLPSNAFGDLSPGDPARPWGVVAGYRPLPSWLLLGIATANALIPPLQAGGPHQEGWAGAAHAAPRPSLGFGVGDPPWGGGHGETRVNCLQFGAIVRCPSAAPCCTNSRALNTFLVGRAPAWRRKLLRKCNYSKQQPHAQALQSTPGTN